MPIVATAVYAGLAALAALAGTALVLTFENWSRRNSPYLISFAAGVMLTIALTGLLPESLELLPAAPMAVFAGFLTLYVVQNIVLFHPCHDEGCQTHLGMISAIGLAVHSLLDGIAIGAGFQADWRLGLLTALAVVLHKMPDGITIAGILLHTGTSRKRIILYSALVAAFTPLGALAAGLLLTSLPRAGLGGLLGFTAGSFLYLAAADLIPETHRVRRRGNALFFFIGTAIVMAVEHALH